MTLGSDHCDGSIGVICAMDGEDSIPANIADHKITFRIDLSRSCTSTTERSGWAIVRRGVVEQAPVPRLFPLDQHTP